MNKNDKTVDDQVVLSLVKEYGRYILDPNTQRFLTKTQHARVLRLETTVKGAPEAEGFDQVGRENWTDGGNMVHEYFQTLYGDIFNIIELAMDRDRAEKMKKLVGRRLGDIRDEIAKYVCYREKVLMHGEDGAATLQEANGLHGKGYSEDHFPITPGVPD